MSNLVQQQVPEGFRQTEVGIIPSDWAVALLDDVAKVRSGIAKSANKQIRDPLRVHCLRVANVQDGYLALSEMSTITVSREAVSQYALFSGDVLMNRGGDLDKLGRGAVWRDEYSPCIHQNNVFSVRCSSKITPDYLNVWTTSKSARRYFMVAGKQTTNLASINKTALRQLPIALPSEKEQTAIANALSDVDALIISLEKLIAKKRAIKTAAMQQLLTGKKRLPPFDQTHTGYKQTELGEIPEDWEVRSLGAAATFISSGKTNTKGSGGFPLYGSTCQIGTCQAPEYEGDSILVARVGANAGSLNFVTGTYGVSDNTIIVKLGGSSDIGFYKYQLTKMNLNTLVFGSSQPLITCSQLNKLLLSVPKPKEQVAISRVLSDMDVEMDSLELRLTKTQQLKQGMMQELLTGRTRLIAPKGT